MHTWPASSLWTSLDSYKCPPIRRPGIRKYSSTGLLTTLCRSLSSRRATVHIWNEILFFYSSSCVTSFVLASKCHISYRKRFIFFFFKFNGSLLTAYLSVGDYNVIGVDWSELARAPFYNSAATNTRDVGKAAAGLVDFLVNEGTPINYIHLLGFSLGAHAAGWAGASVKVGTLPRITGTLSFVSFFLDSRVLFSFLFFAVRPPFSLHSNSCL